MANTDTILRTYKRIKSKKAEESGFMVTDAEIQALIVRETERQHSEVSLIASENYVSPEVRLATSSVLTNKYAEGYPGKRYYAGCEVIDRVEQIAIERCKKLFGAEHANVQPHAGSQANFAAYHALLSPGDIVLGMDLAAGGHLTHGLPVNMSGSLYKWVHYGVDRDTQLLDYDHLMACAQQYKPKLIVVGASAYSRIIDFARCAEIARSVNAYLMADIAHIAGLVSAGIHPHPFPHADIVTSTTHKTLRGPRGGIVMCKKELADRIDRAIMPGTQGGPFMHVIAAKAIAFREASQPSFIEYQRAIVANARAMAQAFKELGYCIVSDGTDNHLFVIDLRSCKMSGLIAEQTLQKAGIVVSRSCIPYDPEKPWITSGIRIGTPAMTTRGMGEKEARQLVNFIDLALCNAQDQIKLGYIRGEVARLGILFPCP